jgi:hypothetical protein
MCLIFGIPIDEKLKPDALWRSVKKAMSDVSFLTRLITNALRGRLPLVIDRLRMIAADPTFDPAVLQRASKAAKSTCTFIRSIVPYYETLASHRTNNQGAEKLAANLAALHLHQPTRQPHRRLHRRLPDQSTADYDFHSVYGDEQQFVSPEPTHSARTPRNSCLPVSDDEPMIAVRYPPKAVRSEDDQTASTIITQWRLGKTRHVDVPRLLIRGRTHIHAGEPRFPKWRFPRQNRCCQTVADTRFTRCCHFSIIRRSMMELLFR